MIANILFFAAVASFFGFASAEFPLVWICIGLTVVGIAIAMYVAYRRPMEPYSPDIQNAEAFEEEPAPPVENDLNYPTHDNV